MLLVFFPDCREGYSKTLGITPVRGLSFYSWVLWITLEFMLRSEMTQDRGWSSERPTMWSRRLELWVSWAPRAGRVWGLKIEFNHVTNDEVIHAYVVNPNKNSTLQLSGCVILQNYHTGRGHEFVASWSEVQIAWDPPKYSWHLK